MSDRPAFPFVYSNTQVYESGLTKRELLSAMAMLGVLAANDPETPAPFPESIADLAVACADALLARLAKDGE